MSPTRLPAHLGTNRTIRTIGTTRSICTTRTRRAERRPPSVPDLPDPQSFLESPCPHAAAPH
ncbi:hypothetical protein ACFYPZ_01060 [Streptomyces sp. NPDC005506]|uniref:hypothetical protein n=1 Tax=unclassified Streptomyces TaxID=2593676 RepID=UPI0036D05FA9